MNSCEHTRSIKKQKSCILSQNLTFENLFCVHLLIILNDGCCAVVLENNQIDRGKLKLSQLGKKVTKF